MLLSSDVRRQTVLRTYRFRSEARFFDIGVYVATGRGNSVAVIDGEQLTLLTLIPVGKRPWGIALTPDGRKLYTANGLSNDVTVIDTTTNKVIGTIKAGEGPWGVAL